MQKVTLNVEGMLRSVSFILRRKRYGMNLVSPAVEDVAVFVLFSKSGKFPRDWAVPIAVIAGIGESERASLESVRSKLKRKII